MAMALATYTQPTMAAVDTAPILGTNSSETEQKPAPKLLIVGRSVQYATIAEMVENDPPPQWAPVIRFALPEIRHASRIVHSLGPFCPNKEDVIAAFDRCPFPPKVVIVGQDPYHSVDYGVPQACGMAFATRRGCKLQPSVGNIFREVQRCCPEFTIPNHGDLTEWAMQGVLLLNTCLTVMPHQPKSHMIKTPGTNNDDGTNIWSGFVDKVLTAILDANPTCIFLLWGADAQKLAQTLGQRSVKLVASHPSPFSAHRETKDAPAFNGCGHFKMVNDLLISEGKAPVDWRLTP
jgi:uracil-DNA glycosylase